MVDLKHSSYLILAGAFCPCSKLLARVEGAEAWSAIVVGDLGAAIVACDESRRLARETSQQPMYALMTATAAKLAALRGEMTEALALAEEAEETGLPVGARPVLATALMRAGWPPWETAGSTRRTGSCGGCTIRPIPPSRSRCA